MSMIKSSTGHKKRKFLQKDLARKFEREYIKDMLSLGIDSVSYHARATTHIPEIINQIERLVGIGVGYITETGVYFNIDSFPETGNYPGNQRINRC